MKKRTSLKDIAIKAGVSSTLVSYILNDKNLDRINKKTAERVKKIAEELQYRPNILARSLRSKHSYIIAVIIPNIQNPLYTQFLQYIEQEAQKRGYYIMIGISEESLQKQRTTIQNFRDLGIDGFLIFPVKGSQDNLFSLQKEQVPFILLERYETNLFPVIATNDYRIMYQAATYCVKNNKKNILLISGLSPHIYEQERIRGYKEALFHLTDPKTDIHIMELDLAISEKHMVELIEKILISKTEAILFTHSYLYIHLAKMMKRLNLSFPSCLITFHDNTDILYFQEICPISIKIPVQEMSLKAVDELIKNIEDSNYKLISRIFNSKLEI